MIEVWDLETILNKNTSLMCTIEVPEMVGCLDVVADEFQLYAFGSSPEEFTLKTVVAVDFLFNASSTTKKEFDLYNTALT